MSGLSKTCATYPNFCLSGGRNQRELANLRGCYNGSDAVMSEN